MNCFLDAINSVCVDYLGCIAIGNITSLRTIICEIMNPKFQGNEMAFDEE